MQRDRTDGSFNVTASKRDRECCPGEQTTVFSSKVGRSPNSFRKLDSYYSQSIHCNITASVTFFLSSAKSLGWNLHRATFEESFHSTHLLHYSRELCILREKILYFLFCDASSTRNPGYPGYLTGKEFGSFSAVQFCREDKRKQRIYLRGRKYDRRQTCCPWSSSSSWGVTTILVHRLWSGSLSGNRESCSLSVRKGPFSLCSETVRTYRVSWTLLQKPVNSCGKIAAVPYHTVF